MRIELPPASWADTAHRADDDAHTLTLVAQAAEEWSAPLALIDPSQTVRADIGQLDPAPSTITF